MIINYAFSAVAAAAGGCFPANTKRLSFTRRKIKAFPRHSLFLFQHQQTPQNKKSKPASKDSCECRLILCMFCVFFFYFLLRQKAPGSYRFALLCFYAADADAAAVVWLFMKSKNE